MAEVSSFIWELVWAIGGFIVIGILAAIFIPAVWELVLVGIETLRESIKETPWKKPK